MKRIARILFAVTTLAHGTAWGGPIDLPREVTVNGVEFMLIPGGSVWVPVPHLDPATGYARDSGMRELQLRTESYYLAKYEARASDFLRFVMKAKPEIRKDYETPPKNVTGSGAVDGCGVRKDARGYYLVAPEKDLPVTHLSWNLANEFATWMGFRLPTEVEWVRAFRGDDKRVFPWGDDYPDDTYAAFQEGATTCNVQPVTAYEKGASPYGVQNMAGNVFEYVADWYNPSHYNRLKDGDLNPVAREPHTVEGDPKTYRVLRGGRWASGPSELSIYGNRDGRAANEPFICFGARFALDAESVRKHLAAGTATVK